MLENQMHSQFEFLLTCQKRLTLSITIFYSISLSIMLYVVWPYNGLNRICTTDHNMLFNNKDISYLILSYLILSYLILSYLILSYLILSYPILSYLSLSYLILAYLILSYLNLIYGRGVSTLSPILCFTGSFAEGSAADGVQVRPAYLQGENGLAPVDYTTRSCVHSSSLQIHYSLRSITRNTLVIPRSKTEFGEWSFTVAWSTVRNPLTHWVEAAVYVGINKSRCQHFC